MKACVSCAESESKGGVRAGRVRERVERERPRAKRDEGSVASERERESELWSCAY